MEQRKAGGGKGREKSLRCQAGSGMIIGSQEEYIVLGHGVGRPEKEDTVKTLTVMAIR